MRKTKKSGRPAVITLPGVRRGFGQGAGAAAATSTDIMRRRQEMEIWNARGTATVKHPWYGAVVVPCLTKYAALLCAARYWGIDINALKNAEVWKPQVGDGPRITLADVEKIERERGEGGRT